MKYYIYTDGAYSRVGNRAAYAYFIRTEKLFVGIGRGSSKAGDIALAEAEAVGAAAEYMVANVDIRPNDVCVFKIDSLYALKIFSSVLKGNGSKEVSQSEIMKNALVSFEGLCERCTVELSKIQSHSRQANGNSYVDRLVKYQLAMSKMKE